MAQPPIPVIDAQVHIWQDGLSTGHHQRAPITHDVLLGRMAAAGVARAVLVPPLWDPNGNSYSLACAAQYPETFAVMALLQFGDWHHDDMLAKAQTLLASPHVVGLRLLFNEADRIAPYRRGHFDALWPYLAQRRVPVALLVPNHLDIAEELIASHPEIPFTIDHLAVPRGASGPDAFRHLADLAALAKYPNLCVKMAGAGDYAEDAFPFLSISAALERIFLAFGPERIIWASDLSRLAHGYRDCVAHVRTLHFLPDQAVTQVLGGNVMRQWGWPKV